MDREVRSGREGSWEMEPGRLKEGDNNKNGPSTIIIKLIMYYIGYNKCIVTNLSWVPVSDFLGVAKCQPPHAPMCTYTGL